MRTRAIIAQVLESGTNIPTIQTELVGAPVPVDLTMEEFADAGTKSLN